MKTFLKLSLTLLLFVFATSCSSEDSNDLNEIETQLLGKWYFENPSTNPSNNNSFTFASQGKVTYSYWDGESGDNYYDETGTFSFNGVVMTMIFPEGVSLVFVQKVVFINDNVVEFQPTAISGEDAYEGDYFRAGASSYENSETLSDELHLYFDTGNIWGSAGNSSCNDLPANTDNINVKLTFISDGVEISSKSFSEKEGYQIHEIEVLTGDIISLKVQLEDFNPDIINRAIFMYDMIARVETINGTILAGEYLGELYYCNESRYEVVFTYNKESNTFNTEEKTHSF